MAKVSNNSLHGKVGDVVYRTMNGIQYVKTADGKKIIPDTEAYHESTSGFTVCCKLAVAMTRIMVLNDHWEKADVDAFIPRTKFVKFNRSRILPGGDISNVQLVSADELLPVSLDYHVLQVKTLDCEFVLTPPDKYCKEVSMQGIVQLTGPKEPGCKNFMCFPFVSYNYRLNAETRLTMNARFSSQETELMKMYDKTSILLNLAFKDIQGRVRIFSETKNVLAG